ncbi:hydrogen gas-evolving membrane-bound hydrogenase subunit E [Candidatus Leptofilum sp.]|uniref:hydrogen gas-evolving membrane-bound hydrogenase subunit E n=1 Tax=Candidatus Leptofilum sp. TaxID=3241576 RepID=UPI003B5CA984
MQDSTLFLPFVFIFLAALIAVGVGQTNLLKAGNGRFSLAWLLAVAPFTSFVLLLQKVSLINGGETLIASLTWLPSLNINFSFYLDGLSLLFALLITGIGTLIIVYAGYYFQNEPSAWRFLSYLLLFMGAMLGLVMAGDIIALFLFWEGTSITSFLLVAYKYNYPEARQGAFKALLITGGGGIALLFGLLIVANVSGQTSLAEILASGELLRESGLYPLMLGLLALAAVTKSAQWPFHIWLPRAMSAPTPASAYLHSATMVKGGIYLMARLNPVLGETELWFWLFSIIGLITMVLGAYLGLKQNDLKALLAYSTISQLGVLMMLIGQDTDIAFKALVVGVLAHALYKSALFLVAGTVDLESGTRDLRLLGGLREKMAITAVIAIIAGLSMAGLPPMFGFLAKETLLATAVHPSLPTFISWVLAAGSVVAGSLMLAQAGLLVVGTFWGKPGEAVSKAHEAPKLMLLAPAIPAVLSLAIGLLPEPEILATLLAKAAGTAFGGEVKVSLALWTGLNVPLLLSTIAISLGVGIFYFRHAIRQWQDSFAPQLDLNRSFAATLHGIDWLANQVTRLQNGRLRFYLSVIIVGMVGLVLLFTQGQFSQLLLTVQDDVHFSWTGSQDFLRLVAILVAVGAAIASVLLKRDFAAIVALGASGLSIAVLMVLEPAPDVALVQVVVDILSVVILVLALRLLPRKERQNALALNLASGTGERIRNIFIAASSGLVVTVITLFALTSRERESIITPFFMDNAKPLTAAKDVVGAIIVDFRALDTMIEIAVFSMAGLGMFTLLRQAAQIVGDKMGEERPLSSNLPSFGIFGYRTSVFVQTLARISLPLAIVVGATHMMYGHDQPGDGFTAGVIISLAIAFAYVVFGYAETRERYKWLSTPLIASGIFLLLLAGGSGWLINGTFLSTVDYGAMLNLPLPTGFNLSSSFLFEVAICLSVLGSVFFMLNTLGHPEGLGQTVENSR